MKLNARALLRVISVSSTLLLVNSLAAEPPAVPHIGVLVPDSAPMEMGLRQGLSELGYVEGKNILIDWRIADGNTDQARQFAGELARSNVALIVTAGSNLARDAVDATKKIPVVFMAGDPVGTGLVENLAHPGGNATGISVVTTDLTAKRVELLRQVAPRLRRIAHFTNPLNPASAPAREEVRRACERLGVAADSIYVRNPGELDDALAKLSSKLHDAVYIPADPFFLRERAKISAAIHKAGLPAIFPWREYHEGLALMSYGPSIKESMRRLASYVDRIIKGGKPYDIPVEEISRYELIINLRVARELGIKVPQDLLLCADEVIR
jgi:putative ABC transport system substrate-binding protein